MNTNGLPDTAGTGRPLRTVTVVGASLAGLYAATELREQGFDGTLRIVGDEPHRPYDRPPLSKGFLTGELSRAHLALTGPEEEAALDAEWLTGHRAHGLDMRERAVVLDDGRRLRTDGLVIATGAAARTLPGTGAGTPAGPLAGVHTLRTLDDAEALRGELAAAHRHVVVIGAGFIGAEVASSCAASGHHVTVVEAAPMPLAAQLGPDMAAECAKLHGDHGVSLFCGAGVAALRGAQCRNERRVSGVELTDGRVLPADVVVVGVGARPHTDWLEDSGLALDDGVVCDAGGRTAVPAVVAAGDVARAGGARAEHWTHATAQARVAARNLLAGSLVEEDHRPPYFWSDQYGVRVQFAGRRAPTDTVRVVEGSPDDRSFLAVYENATGTTAVLALNRPRAFTRLRRGLGAKAQSLAL